MRAHLAREEADSSEASSRGFIPVYISRRTPTLMESLKTFGVPSSTTETEKERPEDYEQEEVKSKPEEPQEEERMLDDLDMQPLPTLGLKSRPILYPTGRTLPEVKPKTGRLTTADVENLIYLVEQRPAIYNFNMSDHYNKQFVETLWEEVSQDLNMAVPECKKKWSTLVILFDQYLSGQKHLNTKFGSVKMDNWELGNRMNFMKEYMNPGLINRNVIPSFHQNTESIFCEFGQNDSSLRRFPKPLETSPISFKKPYEPAPKTTKPLLLKQRNQQKRPKLSNDMHMRPASSLNGTRKINVAQPKRNADSPIHKFFEYATMCLLQVSPKRQRYLQKEMMKMIFQEMDAQEEKKNEIK